jgi:hypothetical protein
MYHVESKENETDRACDGYEEKINAYRILVDET